MIDAARAAGFTQVRELKAWEAWRQGPFKVTGVPARHKVPEITFMIEAKGRTVYFGGDTLFIPELRQLPRMFPSIDLALLFYILSLQIGRRNACARPIVADALRGGQIYIATFTNCWVDGRDF